MNCIFCKIIKGEIPSTLVYEDDKVIAFNDIHPAAPTHILFVPKKHYATLNDIPKGDTIMCDITSAIQKTAEKLGIAESGYRTVINVNRAGGQVVFHLHIHMLGGRPLDDRMG